MRVTYYCCFHSLSPPSSPWTGPWTAHQGQSPGLVSNLWAGPVDKSSLVSASSSIQALYSDEMLVCWITAWMICVFSMVKNACVEDRAIPVGRSWSWSKAHAGHDVELNLPKAKIIQHRQTFAWVNSKDCSGCYSLLHLLQSRR